MRFKGAELAISSLSNWAALRSGCIDRTEFGRSLRRALRKVSDQIERKLRRSGEPASVFRPMRRSGSVREGGLVRLQLRVHSRVTEEVKNRKRSYV